MNDNLRMTQMTAAAPFANDADAGDLSGKVVVVVDNSN